LQKRNDINIASETMDLTVRRPQQPAEEAQPEEPAA
jgi:hypothetical protein